MTRIAVFHIERTDGTTEVVLQPISAGLMIFGEGGIPDSSTLSVLHQAVLDENGDRKAVRSLIFTDHMTVNSEIELHKPEGR